MHKIIRITKTLKICLFIDENKLREIKYYVKYKVRMPRRYGG